MGDADQQGWGGLPVVVLVAAATGLAWLFSNPFVGFVAVLAAGLVALGCVEHVRQRRRDHS